MTTQSLNLPINIPWKLIATSPDMIDNKFGNKLFPFAWRTSLSLSVYEPSPEELPEELCGERITYLKLTCNITGYQPSSGETDRIVSYLSNEPTEDKREALERILRMYYACYGVLVNIAVFPMTTIRKYSDGHAVFEGFEVGNNHPNPLDYYGVKFEAEGELNNHIVDFIPDDGTHELDLQRKLIVTFPATFGQVKMVRAAIVHFGTRVTMEAFKGNNSVGSSIAEPDENTVHKHDDLIIESEEGIDRVVFTTEEGRASLLMFGVRILGETSTVPEDLKVYPHIIDFEPKIRDLYQSSTETGEILTGSKSGIKTDKSFTHTESTEKGWSVGGGVEVPIGKTGATAKGSGSYHHTNTDTDQSQWAVQTDASRERRETQSTTTQISQMYNLLTGYHIGTNRALFLMLARPHILQPTPFRTFVRGLRAIEGVQEFFLIVTRPKDIHGLCVEAFLETGNYPTTAEIIEPRPEYYESFEDFVVMKTPSLDQREAIDTEYTVELGWVIDRSRGDPGHAGIEAREEWDRSNDLAKSTLWDHNYRPKADGTVLVTGSVHGSEPPNVERTKFNRTYRVFTRSQEPKPTHRSPSVMGKKLIITNRGLSVCFKSADCPEAFPLPEDMRVKDVRHDYSIVDEPMIEINPALLTRDATKNSATLVVNDFLKQVEHAMSNSWRLPSRYPIGEVGFLESESFKDEIKEVLPQDYLLTPISKLSNIPLPPAAMPSLAEQVTVGDVLNMNLMELARRTGLDTAEAARVRRILLRLEPGETDGPK